MRLPPTGRIIGDSQAEADAIAFFTELKTESRATSQRYDPFVQVSLRLFDYGLTYVPSPHDDKIVIHSIQNAVISATLQQIQNPPQINLKPVETGEPPTYYWSGPPQVGAMLGLPLEQLADSVDPGTGEAIPPQPMDPMAGEALTGMAFDAASFPALPPGGIRPDWITGLTDASSAQPLQTVLDVIRSRSQVEATFAQYQFDINIRGWSTLYFDFDHVQKKAQFVPVPQPQFYIDPTVREIDQAAWAGTDLILDASDAAVRYPDLADVIAEKSASRDRGGMAYRPPQAEFSETQDINYARATVTLGILWLRNQQVPMHAEEAIAAGLVTMQPGAAPVGEDSTDAAGGEVQEPAAVAFLLSKNGQPVEEGDDAWPMRLGIRELVFVDDQVALDRECPHWDIPIIHAVNIQTSETSPYGFGEPIRMKPLQQAESTMYDAAVRNVLYGGYPIEWMAKSVADELPDGGKRAGTKPGQRYIIDDQLLANLPQGPLGFSQPAPMPQAVPDVAAMVGQKFMEISGHNEVSQGIAPSASASGKMVELLQSANSSMTEYKAWRRKKSERRAALLILHQIVWGMDVKDIGRIISKYPPNVLDAIHTRWRMLEWDVQVDVSTGNGLQVQKRQMAQADLELGAVSLETYSDDTGRDYEQEQRRIAQHTQRQAKLAATMAPPTGQEAGPGANNQDDGKPAGRSAGRPA